MFLVEGEKMEIKERLKELRKLMEDNNINIYYIPTNDYHLSEYTGAFFKEREFMSGFTGSAGELVVTLDSAYLWTDGRYFLQATEQLKNSGIKLQKMGEKGVPTVYEFIKSLEGRKAIGFDGKTVTADFGLKLETIPNIEIKYNLDLVNDIWKDRPSLSKKKGFELQLQYAGETRRSKLEHIQQSLEKEDMTLNLISSLDDIMWILNLRGDDVLYNPVILSYLVIKKDNALLYIDSSKLDSSVIERLNADHVLIRDYDQIYVDAKAYKGERVSLYLPKTNYSLYKSIDLNLNKYKNEMSLSTKLKAHKNDVEIKNIREAHIRDAVAMIKFLHYVKTNYQKGNLTEISVADRLEEFRKEGENFKGLSFDTISGFGPHGAIVHYSATKETDAKITDNNFLLVDSGAQYLEGTTDITRTIVLGKVSDEMKHHFTLVLKGYLALSDIVFKKGTSGATLDLASREPLWKEGLDYNHGTGHGVGCFLNVHEGPQSIRYARNYYPFEEGMLTSDEPGLYIAGKYGIRHESLVICKKVMENEFGEFLALEPVTLVPFDLDGINPNELTKEEKDKLNRYHKMVYDKVSPLLDKELEGFLKKATRAI